MRDTKALARHYDKLTPEERFRLILAAGARGDEAERDRLRNAGGQITLSMQDHAPYAHAFEELAFLVFIELLEEAAQYLEAFALADDAHDILDDEEKEAEAVDEEEVGGEGEEANKDNHEGEASDAQGDVAWAEEAPGQRSVEERYLDMALAMGFLLRTKADGWKRFCEQMTLPTFALWESLPGFDRLQRALKLAERAAFAPEGFLRWLNDIRPAGEAKRTEAPLTVKGVAAATEEIFRKCVEWWGG